MDTAVNGTKNKKILVIEDETALLNAMLDKLTREGFAALGAENGARGLETALREKPDAILLDLVMPEMTGVDVLKALRGGDEWGKNVPVIIMTNLSGTERMLQQIAENKPSYYLVKGDWKIDDVVKKVKEVCGIKD